MNNKQKKIKKGFTLLELLIVIIILAILASIAIPRYLADLEKTREAEARCTLYTIRQAQLAHFADKGEYDANFPIEVKLSGALDVYLARPQSSNFSYTLQTGYGYGKAATKIGAIDYYMCFGNGKFAAGGISCPE